MINKLINVISREAALFESFLELLEDQKKMLVKNDIDGLKRNTETQRQKISESQHLNDERLELIESITVINQIDGDVTVARILEFADQSQAIQLSRLRELILEVNARITEARNSNVMLLNQSRDSISQMVTMLAKINAPEHIYDCNGKSVGKMSAIAIDRRA